MSFYEDIEDHDDHHEDDLDHDEEESNKPIKKNDDDVNEDDEEFEDEYELEYDIEQENDIEDDEDEEEKNYIEDNINFNENELDNESSFEHIVPAHERITSNTLTQFEKEELISVRAQQISQGSYIFVTNIEGVTDPIEIANIELANNKCPLYVKRHIGRTNKTEKYELWNPNEMNKPKA